MAKFFRRLRRGTIADSKLGKYLLYATGEVILVVVGILIALNINNNNESNKKIQELHNIYAIVALDLKDDIADIEYILKNKEDKDWIFKNVIDGLMTRETYEECHNCTRIITGFDDLSLNTNGNYLLRNYTNKFKNDRASLQLEIMQFYSKQLVELGADDAIREADLQNNYNDWKDNYGWYADFISGKDESDFIEYALTSQDYKNRVANYYTLHYAIYIFLLEDFAENARNLIRKIETVNGKTLTDSKFSN